MRVTAETKRATRDRILGSACKLFSHKDFEKTTTRDIARAAKIATGTLFNYFPTKEAVAMTIIAENLDCGEADFRRRRHSGESLEESLFSHVMAGVRRLEPFRGFVGPVIETMMSPFSKASSSEACDRVRVNHMETVAELLAEHGLSSDPSFLAVHLYWTLYLGTLSFWSNDGSPNQEDTLVLLDHSLRLFVASLANNSARAEKTDDA